MPPTYIQKKISYIQTSHGWQTYVFTPDSQFVRYKLLTTREDLNRAIACCLRAGWKVVNATNLAETMAKIIK